nr:hypothetical protein [Tanacetum cinerariifolium]
EKEGKEIREEEEVQVFRVEEIEEGGRIEAIDADEDITLVDVDTEVDMNADIQERIIQEEVNATEPTVFDDKEVTMTMAQTLIKMKAKKARLIDKQMAQRLHDEEIKKAATKDAQEKANLERDKVLQQQYDDKEENIYWNVVAEQIKEKHLDNIRKYQILKRKLVSIAQARKNMIIYLKNMDGYKMEHFKGMTYDKVRPIFKREYKKVQTLFKPDKDVEEPTKKRAAEETLLQESFMKLKAEIHSEGSRSYWKIIRVGGITEAYKSFKDMLKGFDREDLDALWRLVKEKFSSAVPIEDKEKALWVELKRLFKLNVADVFWKLQRYMDDPLTWKLYTNCRVHQVLSTRRHGIFMLTEKDYPLSDAVMILVLSAKLQVYEDCEMARDLVMKIFMEANKPKIISLDTPSK